MRRVVPAVSAGLLSLAVWTPAAGAWKGTASARPVWRSAAMQAMVAVRHLPTRQETCRMVLRVDAGGAAVRLHLSNALSPTPLQLSAVTVGVRAGGAAVRPETLRPVTVEGARSAVLPARDAVLTDPVALAVRPGDDVVVSLAIVGPASPSVHREGAATGWCTGAGTGDLTGRTDAGPFAVADREGLVVDEVQVLTRDRPAVLAVGDSLTDPPLATDTYPRWTDVLAARIGGTPVVNAAIAGNRVVLAGGYGPTLTERFARDVLQRPGLGTVILLAGTNDISRDVSVQRLTGELQALLERARAGGLRAVLVTIPPAGGRSAAAQRVREQVNAWIRDSAPADAVVDGDAVLRDPQDVQRLRPDYDHGDGLHLSTAGHRALGVAVAATLTG